MIPLIITVALAMTVYATRHALVAVDRTVPTLARVGRGVEAGLLSIAVACLTVAAVLGS